MLKTKSIEKEKVRDILGGTHINCFIFEEMYFN